MPIFKPSKIVRSIYEIDGESLQRAGIKAIILNWRNTLTKNNSMSIPNSLKTWLENYQSRYSIKLIILSNSKPPTQGNGLDPSIPTIFEAGKPKKRAFIEALNILGTRRQETAVIGNGIITDLWGGNRLGLYTIFVSPEWIRPRFVGTVKWLLVKLLRI